ncbi:hypothetical protein BASA81_001047 [Batrachochytrium salamandrivorans]|nr:hypothetical protein BASA81_001047 [Batrachochytrium salamandrivorans]
MLAALFLVVWAGLGANAEEADRKDWSVLDFGHSGGPGVRVGSKAVYCPSMDLMLQFGGFQLNFTSGEYEPRNDLFVYDFANTSQSANTSWIPITDAPYPPSPRAWFSMATVQPSAEEEGGGVACQAVVLGGAQRFYSPVTPVLDFAWMVTLYTNLSATWREIVTSGQPPSRFLSDAVTKEEDNTVVLFGGAVNETYAVQDLWQLNATSLVWTELALVNQSISGRFSHSMAYDALGDTVYVYGGKIFDRNSRVMTYSMLAYSLSTNEWVLQAVLDQSRAQHGLVVANNRTLYSFGGMTQGKTNSFAYNDVVATSLNEPYTVARCPNFFCAGVDVQSEIVPQPRFDFSHVLRQGHLLVVFGGRFDGGMGDLWQLNLTAIATAKDAQNFTLKDESRVTDPLSIWAMHESMYFLIAVLIFLVFCYWVFIHTVARTFLYSREQAEAWEARVAAAEAAAPRGVHPDKIKALPTRLTAARAATTAVAEGEEEDVCSICLAEFAAEGELVRVLPCQHYFHPPCVDEWLQNRNTCPLCKQQVDAPPPDVVRSNNAQVVVMPEHPAPPPPPLQAAATTAIVATTTTEEEGRIGNLA